MLGLHAKEVLLHEQSYVTPLQTLGIGGFFLFGVISVHCTWKVSSTQDMTKRAGEKISYDLFIATNYDLIEYLRCRILSDWSDFIYPFASFASVKLSPKCYGYV